MGKRLLALGGVWCALLVGASAPASAEVTGPCDGSATWDDGRTVTAMGLQPGDVVEIPRDARVTWNGQVMITPPATPRDVSGWIKLELPYPIPEATIGEWQDSGTRVENSGSYDYDLPAVLANFEVTVSGKHWEGNQDFEGEPTCAGEVTLKLEGTNPAGFIAGGFFVLGVVGSWIAVRPKGPAAGGDMSA
jgi:hypothetical protein